MWRHKDPPLKCSIEMLTIAWHAGHVSLRPAAFCPGLFVWPPTETSSQIGDNEMLSTTSRDDPAQKLHGDDANVFISENLPSGC